MKARELFAVSHLGSRTIGVSKLRTMNIAKLSTERPLGSVTVRGLAFELLETSNKNIGKIWNIFNWEKSFIYGNDFIYKKYVAILGTIEVDKIYKEISKLEERLNLITVNSVLQGYGVQDSKRNKVLAGIDKSGVDIHEPECTVTVLIDPEKQREVQVKLMERFKKEKVMADKKYTRYRKEKYIKDFVKNEKIRGVLTGVAGKDTNELRNKTLDTEDMKMKKVGVFIPIDEDIDVNIILEGKGIKIED